MGTPEQGALRKHALSIAKALNTISTQTGHKFTMQSQPGRFRIQKAVYILRHLRYPAAQRYSFNIYHMGPYSPDLRAAYYELGDDGLRTAGSASDIPAPTLTIVRDALACPDAILEGLTTTLDMWAHDHNLAAALGQAKAVKPHIGEPTWGEVRRFLTVHPALITPT